MVERAAPFLKSRAQTLKQAPEAAAFIFLERPLKLEGKSAKPLEKAGARAHLGAVAEMLRKAEAWREAARLDTLLKAFAEGRGIGFGEIGQPLRAALTAGLAAPSLGEVLHALGASESLARLNDQAS
jgi:glutamyl-tRNA synthetase